MMTKNSSLLSGIGLLQSSYQGLKHLYLKLIRKQKLLQAFSGHLEE